MTTEAIPTIPKDFITVKETARRTFRSGREITRLLCSEAILGQKLSDGEKSAWVVYWPSVIEYYARRGITFPSISSP